MVRADHRERPALEAARPGSSVARIFEYASLEKCRMGAFPQRRRNWLLSAEDRDNIVPHKTEDAYIQELLSKHARLRSEVVDQHVSYPLVPYMPTVGFVGRATSWSQLRRILQLWPLAKESGQIEVEPAAETLPQGGSGKYKLHL